VINFKFQFHLSSFCLRMSLIAVSIDVLLIKFRKNMFDLKFDGKFRNNFKCSIASVTIKRPTECELSSSTTINFRSQYFNNIRTFKERGTCTIDPSRPYVFWCPFILVLLLLSVRLAACKTFFSSNYGRRGMTKIYSCVIRTRLRAYHGVRIKKITRFDLTCALRPLNIVFKT
jgi:hypothetical protein